MLRRFMEWWRGGPLCDFGTAYNQTGCLRRATVESPLISTFWTRRLRWCDYHKPTDDASQVDGWWGDRRRASAAAGKGRP